MKFETAGFILVFLVAMVLVIVTGTNGAGSSSPSCIEAEPCHALVLRNEGVYVLIDGNGVRVDRLTISLTDTEAKVVTNPVDTLVKTRSYLVTVYGHKPAVECGDVESMLNEYVTSVLVAESVWASSSDRSGPIELCEVRR